jgi:hypothetical protein
MTAQGARADIDRAWQLADSCCVPCRLGKPRRRRELSLILAGVIARGAKPRRRKRRVR